MAFDWHEDPAAGSSEKIRHLIQHLRNDDQNGAISSERRLREQ